MWLLPARRRGGPLGLAFRGGIGIAPPVRHPRHHLAPHQLALWSPPVLFAAQALAGGRSRERVGRLAFAARRRVQVAG